MNVFRTFIIANPVVGAARLLADSWPGGANEFRRPLTSDGTTTSHFISSGYIADFVAAPLPYSEWSTDEDGNYVETAHPGDLASVIAAATPEGEEPAFTEAQLQAILPLVSISTEKPRAAMRRMGLEFLAEE